jgi:hypothetical protein
LLDTLLDTLLSTLLELGTLASLLGTGQSPVTTRAGKLLFWKLHGSQHIGQHAIRIETLQFGFRTQH